MARLLFHFEKENKMKIQSKLITAVIALLVFVSMLFGQVAQAGETITYYVTDAAGSPTVAMDQAGTVVWRESYKPYGDRLKKQDGGANSRWFAGKSQDSDTGLS